MKKTTCVTLWLLIMAIALPTVAFATSGVTGVLDGVSAIFGSIIIGLAVAFLITSAMKKQLKSVGFQDSASHYVEQGSLNITKSKELYLGSHVVRRPINRNKNGRH